MGKPDRQVRVVTRLPPREHERRLSAFSVLAHSVVAATLSRESLCFVESRTCFGALLKGRSQQHPDGLKVLWLRLQPAKRHNQRTFPTTTGPLS